MSSNRQSARQSSRRMAFCGMMVGLAAALMLSGGLLPVATYCAPMAAAVLLLPVLFEYGRRAGWVSYAAVTLISFMLSADKEAAFFYMAIGYYPLIKWNLDRIRSRALRLLCKLAVFNVSIGLMYLILCVIFPIPAIAADFAGMGPSLLAAFALALNVCMLLYDRLLYPLSLLYWNRVRPRLSAFFQ